MPIIKSAKKKVKVSKRNYAQNLRYKETLKKSTLSYLKEKEPKKKEKKLKDAFSAIDKAAKINLIHKNTAARLKSDLIKNPVKKEIKKKRKNKKNSKKK